MTWASPVAGSAQSLGTEVDDLLWIAVMIGLLAATFAYARLCDNA